MTLETVELLIDSALLEEVEEIATPMNLTVEELAVQFFEWCVQNPDAAKAFLTEAIQNT